MNGNVTHVALMSPTKENEINLTVIFSVDALFFKERHKSFDVKEQFGDSI